MRVIAGEAKGRVLTAPRGLDTRPVTAMIREALFNVWQTRVPGVRFLDVFAGSGAMGIEALSRGADAAVFVDRGREAVRCIRKNLELCRFVDRSRVLPEDVFQAFRRLAGEGERFGLVYLDPPFTVETIFEPCLDALSDGALLEPDGLLCIRSRKEFTLPEACGRLQKTSVRRYGISAVHFYEIR